jgi:hypothetical protein
MYYSLAYGNYRLFSIRVNQSLLVLINATLALIDSIITVRIIYDLC